LHSDNSKQQIRFGFEVKAASENAFEGGNEFYVSSLRRLATRLHFQLFFIVNASRFREVQIPPTFPAVLITV
jgi:hypothetical protein